MKNTKNAKEIIYGKRIALIFFIAKSLEPKDIETKPNARYLIPYINPIGSNAAANQNKYIDNLSNTGNSVGKHDS